MIRLAFLIVIAFLAALLFSCGHELAGNGGEITNGNCIAEAATAESAMVVAYPENYVPSSPAALPETTFTDGKGHFSMRLGHCGWNLVIYDKAQVRGAFVRLSSGDSAIDTIVLKDLGAIAGIVNDTMGGPRYVGIIGSPFYANVIGKADTFSLVKIPPHDYSLEVWKLTDARSDTSSKNVFRSVPNVFHSDTSLNSNFALVGSDIVWVLPDSTTMLNINH
jgi:hypothetical protein